MQENNIDCTTPAEVTRDKVLRYYGHGVTLGLMMLYSSMAAAQAFDQNSGPFGLLCIVTKWFAALVVPIATIAFIVAAASFVWGEEMMGMSKKTVNIIVGVCIAFGGGAIVSWIAGRFGFTSTCSSGFSF